MKALAGLLVVFSCVLAACLPVAAQEVSFRTGVVTGISPIEVEARPAQATRGNSRVGGALGRAFGRVAGRTVAKATGSYSYEAYDVANSAARDVAAGAAAKRAGRTETVYMVMVRYDDGSESAIQSDQVESLQVGARVRVFGSGSSARVVPL